MSFDKLQYDVVLVETPTKYVVERYDQPKYPAIGVAYVGNYLEKNVGITPAIIDAKLGRKTIEETIKYVVALKPKIVGLSSMTHNIKVAAYISFEIQKYFQNRFSQRKKNVEIFLEKHLKKVVKFIESKSEIEILAIGIGHDVSRYYNKAIKITDVQELGDVMIGQLSGLFDNKKKFH